MTIDELSERMDLRWGDLSGRMNQLSDRMDHRLGELSGRMDELSERMDHRLGELSDRMNRRFDSSAELVHEVANRLETRLDRMEARLDLQGGKLTAGTRWIARSDEWQDRIDKILAQQAKEMGDLRDRLRKLEGGEQ